MRSKMRRLAVDLVTAGYMADMLSLAVSMALAFRAVGARTRDPFQAWLGD